MEPKNDNNEFKPVERHVKAQLAVLRENEATGWKRVMTVTRWGTGKYKLDIRDWNRDMTRSTKGITFTRDEAIIVRNILMILDMNLIEDYRADNKENSPARYPEPQNRTAPLPGTKKVRHPGRTQIPDTIGTIVCYRFPTFSLCPG